jgi:hypothetical protein
MPGHDSTAGTRTPPSHVDERVLELACFPQCLDEAADDVVELEDGVLVGVLRR